MQALVRFLSQWSTYMESVAFNAGQKAFNTKDYKAAMKNFMPLARRGNARAQFFVGDMYCFGYGLPRDAQEAFKWFRMSAEQGFELAQYNVGVMYHKGEGTQQDDRKALWWALNAARWGHADAQFNVGQHYIEGLGVEEDSYKAAFWYHAAARQGHPTAQYNLGTMLLEGSGVQQDFEQGCFWLSLAASNGSPDTAHNREIAAGFLSQDQLTAVGKTVSEWKPYTQHESAVAVFKAEYQELLDRIAGEKRDQVPISEADELLQKMDEMVDIGFVLGEPVQEQFESLCKAHEAHRKAMIAAMPELAGSLKSINDLQWLSRVLGRRLGRKRPALKNEPKDSETPISVH